MNQKRFLLFNAKQAIGFVFLLVWILVFSDFSTKAADLVGVYPVTNQILMVEFNEGHVDYSIFGNEGANIVYYSALDTVRADDKGNYGIVSQDDVNFLDARQPNTLGRKTKAYEFNRTSGNPPYILRHFIYINLPYTLVNGKSYSLRLNNLADNTNIFTFVYDDKQLFSPTIHVNQVGFGTNHVKYAYLSQWMGTFNSPAHAQGALDLSAYSASQFHLVRLSDSAVVFSGEITKQRNKTDIELRSANFSTTPNSTKADVWQCDFSAFTTPGTYKIAVDGIGCSNPFTIDNDVYREPFNYVMKAIFTQRQGVDKELEGGQVYQRGHTNVKYVGTTTPVDVYGYYYDAGDWDGHNRHIAVPLDLMMLYDLKPGNFTDGDVANRYRLNASSEWVAEGEDGLPDILNEARWLLDFYKRAKNALIDIGQGTGGVPGGRIPDEEGLMGPDAGCEGRASWTDTRNVYLNGEQTANTYNYAAAAAYYSICLRTWYGVSSNSDIDAWAAEALAAYTWADARGDDEGNDESKRAKMLAAAVIYRLTGTVSYQDDLKRLIALDATYPGYDYWQNPHPWHYAAMIYGLTPDDHPGLDVTFRQSLRNAIITKADNDYNFAENRGMRMSFPEYRMAGNGAFSTPRVNFSAFAYHLTSDAKYLRTIQNTTSYTLGGNQNNMTYVAQLGHNPDNMTFHPDSWWLLDYNSKVYKGTSLPGYVNYWGIQTCDWFGCGWNWTVDEDFSRSAASPGISNWPAGEWRMNNKYSIAGSEFTMNETLGQSAFAYGYLAGTNPAGPYIPNERPTLTLNLTDGQDFKKEGCELTVNASEDTWKVKYYYDWHYIGESFDKTNNFLLYWEAPLSDGNSTTLTAVAYDIHGQRSNPSDAADKVITIQSGADCGLPEIAVSGITLAPASANIGINSILPLHPIVLPANATNKNLTWESDNPAIAVVSESGFVTGLDYGTTTITATTDDGGFSASMVITVGSIPVISVTVEPDSLNLTPGQTQQLVATVSPDDASDKSVNWVSSNEQVAIVNNGLVTAVGHGTAIVSVITVDQGKRDICLVIVPQCTANQAESGYTGSNVVVATNQVGYTGTGFLDYGGQNSWAEWTIPVTITGIYNIKVRYGNGSTNQRQCELSVNGINQGNLPFAQQASWTTWAYQEFTATLNAGNNTVRLLANTSSGGPNIDNLEVCTITELVGVTGVTVTPESASIHVGLSVQLTANILPAEATVNTVGWTSNNNAIATVSPSGLVTAVSEGEALIIAITDEGSFSDTATITCLPPLNYSLAVTAANGTVTKNPDKVSYIHGEEVTLTAIANTGYIFSFWSSDASGTVNPLTITMDSDKTITANFDELSGVNLSRSANEGVILYPNPVAHKLTIAFDRKLSNKSCTIRMSDASGRVVYQSNPDLAADNALQIDCSEMPNGIYLVCISLEGKVIRTKVAIRQVKERY